MCLSQSNLIERCVTSFCSTVFLLSCGTHRIQTVKRSLVPLFTVPVPKHEQCFVSWFVHFSVNLKHYSSVKVNKTCFLCYCLAAFHCPVFLFSHLTVNCFWLFLDPFFFNVLIELCDFQKKKYKDLALALESKLMQISVLTCLLRITGYYIVINSTYMTY